MAATSALIHNSRRLFELLRERPHYVFGRYAVARDAYSGLRSARASETRAATASGVREGPGE